MGGLIAIAYLLLADGFLIGQSPGKKLGGVKVVNLKTGLPARYRESAVRNLPFALVALFYYIPIIGWVLFPVAGLFIVAFESYMAWTDRLGLRIGDVFADTQVIDASVPVEAEEPAGRDPGPGPGSSRTANRRRGRAGDRARIEGPGGRRARAPAPPCWR